LLHSVTRGGTGWRAQEFHSVVADSCVTMLLSIQKAKLESVVSLGESVGSVMVALIMSETFCLLMLHRLHFIAIKKFHLYMHFMDTLFITALR
jgi:hypothetical protein